MNRKSGITDMTVTVSNAELPLFGGNVNQGVVRVGDTVRRAKSASSPNVHSLLRHLETVGFPNAPRFLGTDDKGREILTYIDGTTAFADEIWSSDAPLVAATKLLRAFHDATSGISPGDPQGWAFAYPDAAQHEVICHNDFAPYNMIFKGGLPTAIIDFDLAGPGPRLRDVAYLAYWFVPLSFSSKDMQPFADADIAQGCRRLKLVCETYQTADYPRLIELVSEVLHHIADEMAVVKMIGRDGAKRLRNGGHFEHWPREAVAFDANRDTVLRNLS